MAKGEPSQDGGKKVEKEGPKNNNVPNPISDGKIHAKQPKDIQKSKPTMVYVEKVNNDVKNNGKAPMQEEFGVNGISLAHKPSSPSSSKKVFNNLVTSGFSFLPRRGTPFVSPKSTKAAMPLDNEVEKRLPIQTEDGTIILDDELVDEEISMEDPQTIHAANKKVSTGEIMGEWDENLHGVDNEKNDSDSEVFVSKSSVPRNPSGSLIGNLSLSPRSTRLNSEFQVEELKETEGDNPSSVMA